jgi:hypothetical protein
LVDMNVASIEQGHEATIVAPDLATTAEVMAYSILARRGDVLPVCMRLTNARANAEWETRSHLAREVGSACDPVALDRAVSFMPDAPELRLLRAARSMAIASHVPSGCPRNAWLAFAAADLLEATRLDPMDPTARGMLAELVGATAWAATTMRAA